MANSYGIWWFKMAIIYHPKTFLTDPKCWRHFIKSGVKLFWHGVKKTRLRVRVHGKNFICYCALYQITDAEYYKIHGEIERNDPRHHSDHVHFNK